MNTPSERELTLLRQQAVLVEFGEFALKSNQLGEILQRACYFVASALRTDLAKVMELQEDGVTLLVRAGVGWPPGVVGRVTVEASPGSSEGYALQTGKPVYSSNIAIEERFEYAEFIKAAGVKALVNVIIIGGEGRPPYGILQVDSRNPHEFTDDDTDFLRSYANLLAAAVDRMRIMDEMHRTEAALRASEDHFRASIELNPQIPWTANIRGEITSFDSRWQAFTGLSSEDVLRSGWYELAHPDEAEQMAIAWRRALETGDPYDVEGRLRNATGDYRWHRVRASARRDHGGRVVQWYGTVEDIQGRHDLEETAREWALTLEARVSERTQALIEEQHERQVAEEQLRQSQKMEAVGQLTGGIAHDFNNLLAGITGSLEVIQVRLRQGRVSDVDRFVTAALTSAHRAAALTQRLLAFSRRQTLEPRPTNVNELIAGMEDLIKRTVGPSITVSTSLGVTPRNVLCDANQLENALLNLAINARDAMACGGVLTIQTETVTVTKEMAQRRDLAVGEYVCVSVIDTGSGMSPEVAKRAFDPFFTTKPLGEGTGLGLSMIYGFAKQSGGQVAIDSTPDIGTTVLLYLPCHAADGSRSDDPLSCSAASEAAAGETVLVVDDEDVIRMVIVDRLQDCGYRVLDAQDATSALRQIERHPDVDLLLTDVGLPGGTSGRQLADAARMLHPGLKVLFITGFMNGPAVGGRETDSDVEILPKPFTLEALCERVREVIGR